jgi:hypothetical protein
VEASTPAVGSTRLLLGFSCKEEDVVGLRASTKLTSALLYLLETITDDINVPEASEAVA